jgi:hypothetical protein
MGPTGAFLLLLVLAALAQPVMGTVSEQIKALGVRIRMIDLMSDAEIVQALRPHTKKSSVYTTLKTYFRFGVVEGGLPRRLRQLQIRGRNAYFLRELIDKDYVLWVGS